MKIWDGMKRVNEKSEAWAASAAEKFVVDLDRRRADSGGPERKKRITVGDLLREVRRQGR